MSTTPPAPARSGFATCCRDEAEELLKGRVQVINLWRPIFDEPLQDAPLAVCDSAHRRSR